MLTITSGAQTPGPVPGLPTAAPPQLETPPSSTDGARTSDVNARSKRKASPCMIHLSKRARIWTSSGGSSVPKPVLPLSPNTEFSPPSPTVETPFTRSQERACDTEPESRLAREVVVELRSLKEMVETQTELILEQERRVDLLREELDIRLNEAKEALEEERKEASRRESRVAEKLEELIRWSSRIHHRSRLPPRDMDLRRPDTWMRSEIDMSRLGETLSDMPGPAASHLDATHIPSSAHASEESGVLAGQGRVRGARGARGGSWLAEDKQMMRFI